MLNGTILASKCILMMDSIVELYSPAFITCSKIPLFLGNMVFFDFKEALSLLTALM